MANNFNIRTPHAAVLIWNYVDRFGKDATSKADLHKTEPMMISTLSCLSIQTSKSKMKPDGSFNLVLAPFKNWVSTITPGSWCCILMSNEPITEKDLQRANKKHIKMIGRIETVRVDTKVQDDETRRTLYYISGVDWGHIFNNIIYVDNLIAGPGDPASQGNAMAVALREALFAKDGTPKTFAVKDNLRSLINIFGQNLGGFTKAGGDINRLAKSIYNFNMPPGMVSFLQLKDPKGKVDKKKIRINEILNLVTGSLKGDDTAVDSSYDDTAEAYGYINPFSLQGQHTFWQILLENSNPALNEMFCEMRWDHRDGNNAVALTLYNRIKPFAFKEFNPKAGFSKSELKSYFQNVRRHEINTVDVMAVNAGTNWSDKYNFIELKPEFQDFNVIANWYKQKSQVFDQDAFEREGFRPFIVGTKQFPKKAGTTGTADSVGADWDQLQNWVQLMKEWYFDTHKTLNGTLTLHGVTDYIGVGDNIRFDAGLLNPTANMNKASLDKKGQQFVLAHVENISHSFSVVPDTGARTYTTTIQFVRGILVKSDNVKVGEGSLDQNAQTLTTKDDRNTKNTISTSDPSDPDKEKVRGT